MDVNEIVIEREVSLGKDSTAPVPMSEKTRQADGGSSGLGNRFPAFAAALLMLTIFFCTAMLLMAMGHN